jgi:hypothetical protein
MDKENVVYNHNGVLFSHQEKHYIVCRKMDRTVFFSMWNLGREEHESKRIRVTER